jgi:hypothetical protein
MNFFILFAKDLLKNSQYKKIFSNAYLGPKIRQVIGVGSLNKHLSLFKRFGHVQNKKSSNLVVIKTF